MSKSIPKIMLPAFCLALIAASGLFLFSQRRSPSAAMPAAAGSFSIGIDDRGNDNAAGNDSHDQSPPATGGGASATVPAPASSSAVSASSTPSSPDVASAPILTAMVPASAPAPTVPRAAASPAPRANQPEAAASPVSPFPAAASPTSSSELSCSSGSFNEQFLCLLNAYRVENGLNALAYDPLLSQAAMDHSRSMAESGSFSHTGADGSTPWDRCAAVGTVCDAENIAWSSGSWTALALFTSWKESPGHNVNMLGDHTVTGLAVEGGYTTSNFR